MEIIDKRIIVPEGTIGRINSTMMDPIESLEEFYRILTNINLDDDVLSDYYLKANIIPVESITNHAYTIESLPENANLIMSTYLDSLTIQSLELVEDSDYATVILFQTGDTNAFTLNVPNTIEWIDNEVPEFELDKKYIFAIWHNIAFVKEYGVVQSE